MSRDFRLYMTDMCASAEKVLRYTRGLTFAEFIKDEKTFDAVLRNLEVIGEAAKHVPQEVRKRYPQVEWYRIAALRDVVIHEYFGLDEEILWDVVQNEVPVFLDNVRRILKTEGGGDSERN